MGVFINNVKLESLTRVLNSCLVGKGLGSVYMRCYHHNLSASFKWQIPFSGHMTTSTNNADDINIMCNSHLQPNG